jgi:hypothetical protein
MKSFWFVSFISIVFIFVFFFISTGSLSADESTICCTPDNTGKDPPEEGDACYFTPPGGTLPVGLICRKVYGVVEEVACESTGLGLVCDDTCCDNSTDCHDRTGHTVHCHSNIHCVDQYSPAGTRLCIYVPDPGTYLCHCVGPDNGQYDCSVVENNCNEGYIPSCACSSNVHQQVCNSDMSCCTPSSWACAIECEQGSVGGLGDPCECDAQCESGLKCHTWTHPSTCGVVPSDDIICCDGPTDTSCPDRIGYENLGCVEIPDDFPTTCVPRYQCSYGFMPSPTSPPTTPAPISPPPQLPTPPPSRVFCDHSYPPQPVATPPDPNNPRMYTAVGCIPVGSARAFIGWVLLWIVGIAGGIALILIVYAGFMIITSTGNPQRVQAGKELLTAAISGLAVLLFGIFILEFIGFNILNIPGFGI